MKIASILLVAIAATQSARADFSYTTTRKSGGQMPAAAGGGTTRHYLKGQKMMIDSEASATIIDFDAQTVTHLNKTQKTYTVQPFSTISQEIRQTDVDADVDVKETDQHRTINGYNASQVIMTMSMSSPQGGSSGMKMQVEMETWVSADVPGAQELRAFYQRNAAKFPWTAMAPGGNPAMQRSMTAAMKKMANLGGVPLLQIVKPHMAGAPAPSADQSAQMQQGMAQARARLEAMAAQGGPGADYAKQALARMGGGPAGSGSSGGFEMTMESGDFSKGPIPDSMFAIPAGYQNSAQ
jgi:hypothetical protein